MVSWCELNPALHTVEAVRAHVEGDSRQMQEVTKHWLDYAEDQGLDMLEAAGLLLRDAYGFAGILARTLTHDEPESLQVLMDAYCLQAMEDA